MVGGYSAPTGWPTRWDLGKRVALDGGTQLIYEGEGALGKGSYGVVFPCKLKLGKEEGYRVIDAVVKCEKKECSKDGFEIHKWRQITPHRNLVRFYDGKVLEPGESAHFGALLAFEKMDCSLKELISHYQASSEKCTIQNVVRILKHIVQGLVHLKKNGFMHMDLKPDNILVSGGSGERILAKITDLGISKALKDGKESVTATCRGSTAYMAPEVFLTKRIKNSSYRITTHADVYSIGILMSNLFDAEVPHFISQESDFVTEEIKIGDVCEGNRASCCAPKELCSLMEKCLQFDQNNVNDSRAHGRPCLLELWDKLVWIKKKYPNVGKVVHRVPNYGFVWDLGKRIDLDGGTVLIYEGEPALGEGLDQLIFPCKLELGGKGKHRVIDAVVKCEKKKRYDVDGYEIGKVRELTAHDNLVKFYDGKVLELIENENFGALMVFERMDCNLEELLFTNEAFVNSATYGDIVNILVQIVHGLNHLHNSGFLHMDVKPHNILVSKGLGGNLLVKICDFGASKRLSDDKSSVAATYQGTENYMAPEVYMAPRFLDESFRIGAEADVYSLGILMFAILNKQRPPFTSQDWGSEGREILFGSYRQKVFCNAPLELCDLIEKCLLFEIYKLQSPRLNGRPSLEEISEALKGMKGCGWMNETVQTKVCASFWLASRLSLCLMDKK